MDSPTPSAPLSHSQPSKPSLSSENDDQNSSAETPTPNLKRKSPVSPRPRKPKPKSSKDLPDQSPAPRRKAKKRVAAADAAGRRPRKRSEETVVNEDNEIVLIEDGVVGRPRKRRQRSKQPPLVILDETQMELTAYSPATATSRSIMPKADGEESNVSEMISELVMWKNVAKSTLWFGSGSIFFLSSCFSRDSNFSIISASSHVGILILGIAFFHDSLPQRDRRKPRDQVKFQLTEDDFIRAARLILPTTNAVLAKCQKIFSGEPSMTLKVAPILLLMAKYGHLITPWRLLATGFFLSFTLPKLYSSYAERIHKQVKEVKNYAEEAWKSCPRKKLVATSTAMLLWNLSSIKMRMFAAFMSIVVFRHKKQPTGHTSEEIERGVES